MPLDASIAHVGASLVKGLGARDCQIPVAMSMRLTLFTRLPLSTPPKTEDWVAVWAKPYRTTVLGYGLPDVHGPATPGAPPGGQVGVGVTVGVGVGVPPHPPPARISSSLIGMPGELSPPGARILLGSSAPP